MRLPPKLWKLLRSRRVRIFAACSPFALMAVLAIFYGSVNAWGARKEREWFKGLAGRGIETRPEVYFGDHLPGAENAFGAPVMTKWLGDSNDSALYKLGAKFSARSWQYGTAADLAKMVTPPSASEREAAENLLAKEPAFEAEWPEVRQALRRPDAGFPGEKIGDRFTSSMRIRRFGDYAGAHGAASIVLGHHDEALADIQALIDLERHMTGSRATLVTVMTASPEQRITCALIWEGIKRGLWSDEDLQYLGEILAVLTPAHDGIQALRGEMVVGQAGFQEGRADAANLGSLKEIEWKRMKPENWDEAKSLLRGLWLCVRPSGFSRMQIVKVREALIQSGLQENGQPRERFEIADLTAFQKLRDEYPAGEIRFKGGTYFEDTESAWYLLTSLSSSLLKMQTELELVRTGLALERYRMKNGSHPEKLEALAPEFLPAVPVDPFTEQPLRYRRQADGSPLVWSIGRDLVDDGGLPKRDAEHGDQTWMTQPIHGYTEKQFNRW